MKFSIWLENKKNKKIIIMRGISGSGKSTLAKSLGGLLLSTDDFFMKDGRYEFDVSKLGLYHKKNQERTEDAMINGISPIIIDNTNSQRWEMKPYVDLADKYDYDIEIKELPIPSISELLRRQESRKSMNKSLPLEVLTRMINKFEKNVSVDDIRNS